jgi:hypothetical protein
MPEEHEHKNTRKSKATLLRFSFLQAFQFECYSAGHASRLQLLPADSNNPLPADPKPQSGRGYIENAYLSLLAAIIAGLSTSACADSFRLSFKLQVPLITALSTDCPAGVSSPNEHRSQIGGSEQPPICVVNPVNCPDTDSSSIHTLVWAGLLQLACVVLTAVDTFPKPVQSTEPSPEQNPRNP